MAKTLTYNATVTRRDDLTDLLATFRVKTDDPLATKDGRWFVPGQYVAIGMNNEAEPDKGSVTRAMSIASAPQETDGVEFYIRYVTRPESDNPLTHLMWKLEEGDRIHVRQKPVGKFTLEHTVGTDDPRLKIYVAAGTGLAPFRAIARAAVLDDDGVDLSRHVVLHGASYPSDLGYRDELLDLAQRNKLHYYGTVSRPNEAPDWTGDAGRVEDYFKPDRLAELEERLGLPAGGFNADNVAVFVCGLQGTISQSIQRLLARGLVPDNRKLRKALEVPASVTANLFFEQYDNTPVLPVDDDEVMDGLRATVREAHG